MERGGCLGDVMRGLAIGGAAEARCQSVLCDDAAKYLSRVYLDAYSVTSLAAAT